MKKIYTTILILILQSSIFTLQSFSQAVPVIAWQKCLGGSDFDMANGIQQTADGGYIVVSYTNSNDGNVSGNHGGADVWIVKLDGAGSIQWQKCFGGTQDDDAFSIQQTADGGYVFAGRTSSNDGDVTGNHGGNYDCWVVKLDGTGTIQWQKCLGGTGEDEATAIQQTADGGFVFAGWTTSDDGDVTGYIGSLDYWVVKLDTAGIIQWQKCLGGTDNDYGYALCLAADGGCVVAGGSDSNDSMVSGNHGYRDYWVAKLDTVGSLQWQICLGSSWDDEPSSVLQTFDGGYLVGGGVFSSTSGNVSGGHGNYDYWIAKLNPAGVFQWQKCLGGSEDDYSSSVQQTADGGYVMTGMSLSND
ncbi:MAG: hypothetical protein ABI855_15640, partial [Bacteroidota bacterium]